MLIEWRNDMGKLWSWLGARLGEKSTWISLIGFIALLGVQISPEQSEAIAMAGVAVTAVILLFTKES